MAAQEFTLAPYPQSKDVQVLGDVEEVQYNLEDNQSMLQTMLRHTSPPCSRRWSCGTPKLCSRTKCFDNIASLIFTDAPNSIEAIGMVSGEGERVTFVRSLFVRGNMETWLQEVETTMRLIMKYFIKQALVTTDAEIIDRSCGRPAWHRRCDAWRAAWSTTRSPSTCRSTSLGGPDTSWLDSHFEPD